ncbi:MAG: ribosome hibernation-promoting factor, HPF/YfiA family [Nitrospinota bacterium]
MDVHITIRKMALTPALRAHAEERIRKLEKSLERPVSLHLVLDVERHRQRAELTLHMDGASLHAREATGDMYQSIDRAVEKMEARVRRFRERRRSRRPGRKQGQTSAPPTAEEEARPAPQDPEGAEASPEG